MIKNIFIDSNIWFALYSFSNDDLVQFMKLKNLIVGDIKIWLPKQVRHEVMRNRENKLKETMTKFEAWKFDIPNIAQGYSQYNDLVEKTRNLKKNHKDIISQIKNDILEKKLHADRTIKEIFELCRSIEMTDTLINNAVLKDKTGNPPGKNHKYGDAINWLSLLNNVPGSEDLFFIGADEDYQSVFEKSNFNQFLWDEWKEKKNSNLYFFKSLIEFFNTHLKVIQLKNELLAENEINLLISELENSGSFEQTHAIVARLSKLNIWAKKQHQRIIDAVANNSQVGLIREDDDIAEFLSPINSDNKIGAK